MRTKCMALLAGALLTAGSLCAQAQSRVNDKKADRPRWTEEEIMERRAESMAAKLMLDDKTEAEFVSLYAQYLKELKDCREHYREAVPGPKGGEVGEPRKPLTDAEIEARMERRFEKQRQLLDIHEKYYKDFKKMLTPKQLQKVFEPRRPDMNRPHWNHDRRPDAWRGGKDYRNHRHHWHGCCR